MSNDLPTPSPVPPKDATFVAEVVSESNASGIPLPVGLRAAADEAPTVQLADCLRDVASSLESGQSLDDLLGNQHSRYGRYLCGLIRTAAATGNGPIVFHELLEQHQSRRNLWRSVTSAMTYPIVLLGLTFCILMLIEFLVVVPMVDMYEEFELELPFVTRMLLWFYRIGFWWFIGLSAIGLLAALLLRLLGGSAGWQRVIATVPLIGAMCHWSGVAEWTRVLSLLLKQDIALPSALRLTADGVHNGGFRALSLSLADDVAKGMRLADAIDSTNRFPPTLIPVVRWGESAGRLDEALQMASEMFEGRVHMRAQLLKSILPPVVFICVAVFAVVMVVGLYAPMFSLINALA